MELQHATCRLPGVDAEIEDERDLDTHGGADHLILEFIIVVDLGANFGWVDIWIPSHPLTAFSFSRKRFR